jgi:hypothetical protein
MAVEHAGRVTVQTAMAILRSHGLEADAHWRPDGPIMGSQVCMHAGFGPIRESQSVGSLIAHLSPAGHTYWATATAGPCTSLFKPVWLDSGLENTEPALTARYDPGCRWWRHERLHRAVLVDLPLRLGSYLAEREEVEKRFLASVDPVAGDRDARRNLTLACFSEADHVEAGWLERVNRAAVEKQNAWYYRRAWQGWNRAAQMPE